jgi:hypothetical protein
MYFALGTFILANQTGFLASNFRRHPQFLRIYDVRINSLSYRVLSTVFRHAVPTTQTALFREKYKTLMHSVVTHTF